MRTNRSGLSVILANVARNHSYPIAEAAAEAGYLEKFITSIYHRPSTASGRALAAAARMAGPNEARRIEGRRSPRIPDDRVVSIPLPELLEQAAWRVGDRIGWDTRPPTYLKNEAFDWLARRHLGACTIFHGFEQCALFCLRRAKRLGAITVLDQPIIHRRALDLIEGEERSRLGVPAPARHPFWHEEHIRRKYEEHALADYVFVGLDFVKRTMVEHGFSEDRVFVIPYGAEVSDYSYVARPRRDGLHVLYVGPLHYWKGLHYLLDAMARVREPGVRLTVVGRAHPDWEGYFRPRIAALQGRVTHIPGVPHAEMGNHYREADVLAFPSLVGGLGLVCYEAMATGLPVVTSDGDVIIRDGVDGFCVPARDVEGWARMFDRLARNQDERARVGQAGAERVQKFDWGNYRRGIVRAYEEIVERERSRGSKPS